MDPNLLIAAAVGIFASLFVLSFYLEKKRRQGLTQLAAENGWLFDHRNPPGGSEWPQRPWMGKPAESRFPFFQEGSAPEYLNFFFVESAGTICHIFDYKYTTGSGKNRSVHEHTVCMMHRGDWNLPVLSLRPQHLLHGIGKIFGMQDIDLGEHPVFSKRYLLKGKNESEVRRLFENRDLVHYFEERAKGSLNMQATGDSVLYWHSNPGSLGLRELPKFVAEALALAAKIR